MARRRKGDAKPSVKIVTDKPAPAVRKSRRQIAKKQQVDKKVNGEAAGLINSKPNDSEESEGNKNSVSVVQHKKFGKYRCAAEENKETSKGDVTSDSQDVEDKVGQDKDVKLMENDATLTENDAQLTENDAKLTENDAKLMENEATEEDQHQQNSDEVIWQEDVIEETIEICEEMEVEDDGGYEISQDEDGTVLLEEVLLVNNHDFEGEDVVEFTVIRNEDGTESMVVARDDETISCKDYVAEALALPKNLKMEEKEAIEFREIEKRVGNISVDEINEETRNKIATIIHQANPSEAHVFDTKNKDETGSERENDKPEESEIEFSDKREEEVRSIIIGDKFGAGIPFLETLNCETDNDVKTEDFFGCMEAKSNEGGIKTEDFVQKEDKEKIGEKCEEGITGNVEESSGDSEVDIKADTEDIKVSSSSENSNDGNGYKLPEFLEAKSNAPSQQNEAEKKTGFRSRSGSTDTTGSESGSNSSGVRRSSRIRSIGLMKQR